MRYGFGCDHAGFDLKEVLIKELIAAGHEVVDMGTDSRGAHRFHRLRQQGGPGGQRRDSRHGRPGVRHRVGHGAGGRQVPGRARGLAERLLSRPRWPGEHSDANILCLGARVVGPGLAVELLRTWLATDFEGGRYAERLQMMRGGYKGISRVVERAAQPPAST